MMVGDEMRPDGKGATAFEAALLMAVPAVMGVALWTGIASSALLMLAVVTVVLVLFFLGYERSQPALRQIMPTLVLAACAAAGRILFAPIPDFKPLSAIAIIAGATLGPRNGFMVGSLAAFTSNFFFGQGLWSPWQMYAWGMVGYAGGLLAKAGVLEDRVTGRPRTWALVLAGLASAALYGLIVNAYGVLGFVRPLTWAGTLAYVAASLPFDVMHGVATALFLVVLYGPWTRRIGRVVRKYGLRGM